MAVSAHILVSLLVLVVWVFCCYTVTQKEVFKRIEGGFIFRWRAHNYLLTEAQKAEIQRPPRGFLIRGSAQKIGQVLEGARHTEQKITWRDWHENYARMWPMSVLFGVAVASALLFVLMISISPAPGAELGFLAVCIVFLFYLAILRLRLERLPKR